jgi:hypothetical protein
MALTTRNSGDLIGVAAVNDFKDLLTGVMVDQLVTLASMLTLKAKGTTPAAPSQAIAAGGSVDVGAHSYAVTFVGQTGEETAIGTAVVATTSGGNQTVNLTSIPTGPSGTTARKVYRTKVGGTTFFLVTTLSDNTTTTYSDTATDASLAATNPPSHSTFGGTTRWQNSSGTTKAQVFGSDGAVSFDGGNITSDGAGALTMNGALSVGGNLLSTGTGSLAFTGAGRTDPGNDTTPRVVKSATGGTLDFVGGASGFRFIKNSGSTFTTNASLDNNGNLTIAGILAATGLKAADGTSAITIANATGDVTLAAILNLAGALKHTTSPTSVSGTTLGTYKWYMPFQGAGLKILLVYVNGYENTTATAQNIVLPADFVSGAMAINIGAGSSWTPKDSGGSGIQFSETTWGTGTGSGTQANRTGVGFSTIGHVNGAIHSVDLPVSMGSTVTGWFILIGF